MRDNVNSKTKTGTNLGHLTFFINQINFYIIDGLR